jgi:DNA polymerase-3 subunit alpha
MLAQHGGKCGRPDGWAGRAVWRCRAGFAPGSAAAKAWNMQEKLDQEFAAIGFYFSGHPLDDILDSLEDGRITYAMNIEESASTAVRWS